ncbi:hypothetical protein [Vallitalea maricola]|uniref:Uncharacterized protein n=1 Tax=Vallitalea maricola TaxID=3074433 RepID=A0ACB5UMS5_9FIRM|nr:hypothetical protein AN2V17_30690 [Vallitalea sp. AN17-2]
MSIRVLSTPTKEEVMQYYSLTIEEKGVRIFSGGKEILIRDSEEIVKNKYRKIWNKLEIGTKPAIYNGKDISFSLANLLELKQRFVIRSFIYGMTIENDPLNIEMVYNFAQDCYETEEEWEIVSAAVLDITPKQVREWKCNRDEFNRRW